MGCVELRRENWKYLQFEDVFVDVSKRGKKIPKSDYLSEGRFPIIDQGQKYVAGYSNSSEKLYSDVPALIFGDHTRIIKYVDVPFFLGADGVKLLKSKLSDVDYKFLYYVLSQLHIIDTGYNRHFKYLKEQIIPLPPLDEQKRIADVLDKASELIKKRKEQIRLMDELAKSLFIEMFGDPVENPMGWDVKKLGDLLSDSPQNGLYKPSSSYANGDEGTPILRIDAFYDGKITDLSQLKRLHCNENEIILYSLEEGDIVINRVNSMEYLGKCAYIPVLCESTVFESNMMRLKIQRDILHPRYAVFLLCSKFIQQQIMSHAKKAVNQASINQTDVMDFNFHIPPLSLQNEFADRINVIEQQKALLQNGLAKMETAYKALMQEYFG